MAFDPGHGIPSIPTDNAIALGDRDHVRLTGTKFRCGIKAVQRVHRASMASRSAPAGQRIWPPARRSDDRRCFAGRRPSEFRSRGSIRYASMRYCQSGMIMSALALLQRRASPSDADIDAAVTNACRCGTYHRVRQAIHLAADLMKNGKR